MVKVVILFALQILCLYHLAVCDHGQDQLQDYKQESQFDLSVPVVARTKRDSVLSRLSDNLWKPAYDLLQKRTSVTDKDNEELNNQLSKANEFLKTLLQKCTGLPVNTTVTASSVPPTNTVPAVNKGSTVFPLTTQAETDEDDDTSEEGNSDTDDTSSTDTDDSSSNDSDNSSSDSDDRSDRRPHKKIGVNIEIKIDPTTLKRFAKEPLAWAEQQLKSLLQKYPTLKCPSIIK